LPGFDDRLKQHLEKVAPPADPSGAFDRILEKKIRLRLMRRFQAAGLAVAVVAATIGGTFALVRAFESGDDRDHLGGISPTPVPVSNGLIAYASMASGNWDIWTAMPDGTRTNNITAESLADETDAAWSPDGTKIAFVSNRGSSSDIYIMDPEGAEEKRIASGAQPAWSPDGRKIAYVSGNDIYVIEADGAGAPKRLTSGQRQDRHPTWSPDGSRIAFARYVPDLEDPDADSGIYAMNPDGSEVTRLTKAHPYAPFDDWPDWSPDGRRIVFQRGSDIFVLNLGDMEDMPLTADPEGLSGEPAWAPDGTKIVFERGLIDERSYEVFVMNADGSDRTGTGLIAATASEGSQDPFPINPGILPDWQPVISGSSPSPVIGPTPTAFPSACDPSIAVGDFDGDGQPDKATVAKTECLPGDRSDATEYSLHVQWPPSEGVAPLPDCKNVCRAIAVTDLNGDGIDEFILQIDEGPTNRYLVYELPASEAFGRPSDISPPGNPEFPAGEPARFSLGGSVERYVPLGCDLIEHQVIVQIAELNAERTRFNVHEILLRFDPIEAPPFGRFTVISERDFTETHEEGIHPADQFEPGDPCWMQQF
jgi:TolB protein